MNLPIDSVSSKASRLSPASARGFFDVPSLTAAPHSGDILSGNRGEGASKNLIFRKVDKCRLLVSGSYVIPGQTPLQRNPTPGQSAMGGSPC